MRRLALPSLLGLDPAGGLYANRPLGAPPGCRSAALERLR